MEGLICKIRYNRPRRWKNFKRDSLGAEAHSQEEFNSGLMPRKKSIRGQNKIIFR
jgi:hypothetical protein